MGKLVFDTMTRQTYKYTDGCEQYRSIHCIGTYNTVSLTHQYLSSLLDFWYLGHIFPTTVVYNRRYVRSDDAKMHTIIPVNVTIDITTLTSKWTYIKNLLPVDRSTVLEGAQSNWRMMISYHYVQILLRHMINTQVRVELVLTLSAINMKTLTEVRKGYTLLFFPEGHMEMSLAWKSITKTSTCETKEVHVIWHRDRTYTVENGTKHYSNETKFHLFILLTNYNFPTHNWNQVRQIVINLRWPNSWVTLYSSMGRRRQLEEQISWKTVGNSTKRNIKQTHLLIVVTS